VWGQRYTAALARLAASRRPLSATDVFVAFLALYLLTARIGLPFGDSVPMWKAAESLVRHGTFSIDVRWPVNAPVGRDGHYYPVAALLACLIHVPGALLQRGLEALGLSSQTVVITSQLGPLVVGALIPALFFRLLRYLGYGVRAAAGTTLLLGAGTSLWVYAHQPYSEILQAACFLAFFDTLLRAGEAGTKRSFILLGITLGLLVNAKNVYVVCIPAAAVFLVVLRRADRRALAIGSGWTALGFAPGLIALLLYNYLRWGSITSSGYEAVTHGFWNHNVLWGLWGQLFSPGKSVFLFSPVLLLALVGTPRLVARRPTVALAIGLTVVPIVLIYARYQFWSGDWGWGPRYLVFALPVLVLPVAELFSPEARLGRGLRIGVATTFIAAFGVQAVGNLMSWDSFTDVAVQAQRSWLGRPDSRGTVLAPYPCPSCFEHVYGVQWLPPMQPISGQWWLARHKLAGDDWKTAEADAPWKAYTSLPLDIKEAYESASVDIWVALLPPGRRLPLFLLVTLLAALAIPVRRWRAPVSAGSPPAPS
jgi:hypothetical protein